MRLLALILALAGSPAAACTVDPASQSAYPGSVVFAPGDDRGVTRAWFDDPVTRYRHFVLGRRHEPEALWVDAPGNHGNCGHKLTLDAAHVFEDVAPRLEDLDGDGANEVIVVRSHRDKGAQLAVYRWTGSDLVLDATTPYIGTAHRWLAPVGAADLDGDGAVEIAYVDRPHLARLLRVWRYADGGLTEVAQADVVTNHRIGEAHITGGIRDCGEGPEMVLATGDWSHLIAVRLRGGGLTARQLEPYSAAAATAAMACR